MEHLGCDDHISLLGESAGNIADMVVDAECLLEEDQPRSVARYGRPGDEGAGSRSVGHGQCD
jgi:hypothetical protein